MKYVFGPVPSWRLGRSLGVDPVPLKTCNWNCAYCQLGRTRPVVNERREYVPVEAAVTELREALTALPDTAIDWVTFLGSGEPLLHARLGELLRTAKAMTRVPVALITNGSLLWHPTVRQEVAVADAVMPTLDVGSPALYRRLNRPHPEITFERHVAGLIAFREAYRGRLWLEVMLVRDFNDTTAALGALAEWLVRIRPDEIHLNVPSRPAVEQWVHPPARPVVQRAAELLGRVAPVRVPTTPPGGLDAERCANLVDAVAGILQRHPMSEQELTRTMAHRAPERIHEALAVLASAGRARVVIREGTAFWVSTAAHFPEDSVYHPAPR